MTRPWPTTNKPFAISNGRDLSGLTSESWDLVVIGGGILGAGVARDAVLRGLRVALVEQSDFGSGSSSRSTKLIHGGFRYLEQWRFGLVAEACRERRLLLQLAPHLVHSIPFLLPVYRGDPRPLWKIRAGMTLYDWLGGSDREHRHHQLPAEAAVEREPMLESHGLLGAIAFYDAQMDDARLCLETILDASHRGAACVNYCKVIGIETAGSRMTRVTVHDRIGGGAYLLRARAFVNAAGPWVEQIARLTEFDPRHVALSPTKGVHLILPRLVQHHGIYFQSRHDQRMLFLLPFGEYSLLGTTDTDFASDPSMACADAADIQYLLDRLRDALPRCAIRSHDIIASFAGVRPLLRDSRATPSERPREHRLIRHGANLLTVAGGKYTTFRAISQQAVAAVYQILEQRVPPCQTATTPLPDRRPAPSGMKISESPIVWQSDIEQACRREFAWHVADVMRRRTLLSLSRCCGASTAQTVSEIMARELGWDEAKRRSSLGDYLGEWQRNRCWTTENSRNG